ncbi:MAG TPA: type II toxin-antitoxin system VapB family antitoxin [Acidobacteriaceae bacterium]|jgi:Arc/MetJ family transcription regulator|nr:type II toxin-antitoxin system VapB family antitoxin [Acidobacteriaceae bacterium]
MRTTVTLDDELVKKAQEYSGIREKSLLVNAALKMMIEWEASRRAALLGGTMPGLKAAPRKRSWVEAARRRRSKAA